MAFDKKNIKGFNSICNNNLSQPSKTCHSKRQLNNPIIKDKDKRVPIGNKFDHSSWSLSVDEYYIEFFFGKDVAQRDKGVKSKAPIKSLNGMHKNPTPVYRKLKYLEDQEHVSELNIHEKRSNASYHHNDENRVTPSYKEVQCGNPEFSMHEEERVMVHTREKRSNANRHHNDEDRVTPSYKEVQCHNPEFSMHEEEREMVHTGTQQYSDRIRRASYVEGIEGYAESRNSDRSEDSRGSFAFPILGWEWIGSPVQMPKSEDLHQRKHKARAGRFQCCRF
ncbi:hypothetical protein Fmac_012685 [Flemingia macrophylla]|uniref:Uncharacterized protein n=1 Tax=Flemingia macrophylla TaxID=520843 RepID=A0ABD1MR14_9FABA